MREIRVKCVNAKGLLSLIFPQWLRVVFDRVLCGWFGVLQSLKCHITKTSNGRVPRALQINCGFEPGTAVQISVRPENDSSVKLTPLSTPIYIVRYAALK